MKLDRFEIIQAQFKCAWQSLIGEASEKDKKTSGEASYQGLAGRQPLAEPASPWRSALNNILHYLWISGGKDFVPKPQTK